MMTEEARADDRTGWYAAHAPDKPRRQRLGIDADVDVCVIGGGIAGLTAAYEAARLGRSVVLLESRRIAWSASGRNCGIVGPGFAIDVERIVERIGLARAKRLFLLSQAGAAYMRHLVGDHSLAGVDLAPGRLDVATTDDGERLLARAATLAHDFGVHVEAWPTDEVRAVLRTERYFQAIHYPDAFHMDPLAYALALGRLAEDAGARIYEETPAVAIDPAGVRKRITTPNSLVRAGAVVLAGGLHVGDLMPTLAATLTPITGVVAVSEPLGDRLAAVIGTTAAMSEARSVISRHRVVQGDRLMWCGGGGFFPTEPAKARVRIAGEIAATYPDLGPVEIADLWATTVGVALHAMPQIGEMSPGVWLASGFGAHGLANASIAGKLIAHAIAESDDTWRAFEPYELVWAGGRVGRLVEEARVWTGERTRALQDRWRDRKAASRDVAT